MAGHEHGTTLWPLLVVGLLTLAYLGAVARQTRLRRRRWNPACIAAWIAGTGALALGLSPSALPFPVGDIRQHMLQHLLLGMFAPIGLVMGAPMTLALNTLPRGSGRVIVRVLRSRAVRIWANPAMALFLNLGGMAALYFTPLYRIMMAYPGLHGLMHLHFVAAGCLYVWVLAGPDPAPHRPSVPARLIVLGVAVVLHSVMAQLLYAGVHVDIGAPAVQLREAAELMYYGGDVTEMLLAFAVVSTWRPTTDRAGRKRQKPCCDAL